MEATSSLISVSKDEAKIDGKYVHKAKEENVLISDIYRQNDIGGNVFECNMVFDHNLPFFFEHYLDHVPGVLMIEAARQMKTAVSHLYYGIEFDYSFVLFFTNAVFNNFAELYRPVSLRLVMDESGLKTAKGSRKIFNSKVFVMQDDDIKAEIESNWRCIHRMIMNRMRSKKILAK